jgi:hypothetical protein
MQKKFEKKLHLLVAFFFFLRITKLAGGGN